MAQLNDKQSLRRLGVTRRQLLEEIDRPALNALPDEPYEYSEWRVRRVGVNYHVDIDAHYYSVPYRFARAEVEARLTARGVEIFHKGERIAVHLRGSGTGSTPPFPSACPPAIGDTPAGRSSASGTTPAGSARRRRRSASRSSRAGPIPSRAIAPVSASCGSFGSFGAARVEAAAERAIEIGARTYGSVKIHPRRQARSEARANAPRGHRPDPSSQHPRAALLPLGDANVLKHLTLDQLHTLGLHGMAKAFADLADADEPRDLSTPTGSPCSSTGRRHGGGTNASRPGCAPPNCVSRRASRTSTIAPPEGLDHALFRSSQRATDRRPRQSRSGRAVRRRQELG